MRAWFVRGVLFAALPWLGACGGSPPSAPSTPTPVATPDASALAAGTALTVVSGEDGEAVAGARIVVAGRTYEADSRGQVTLAERTPFGSFVDVVALGFLDRQTLIRRGGSPRFVLWPRANALGIREAYTIEIVYTAAAVEPSPAGSSALRRPRLGTTQAFVVLSEDIRQDDRANRAHQAAVATLNAALEGRIVYSLATSRPAAGVVFEARVNADAALCADGRILAYTSVTLQSAEITGGQIVYCGLDVARTATAAHELGHTLGLQHSPDHRELMFRYSDGSQNTEFSKREALVMALMLERRGGNRFPDNDRDVPAGATGTLTIVCP